MDKPRSFLSLAKEHLSLRGETLVQFSGELKKLTEKDRADLREEFVKNGYPISDQVAA